MEYKENTERKDFWDMIQAKLKFVNNLVFIPDKIINGKFGIRSSVLENVALESPDFIIYNPETGEYMKKQYIDMVLEKETMPMIRFNYQEGMYNIYEYKFIPNAKNLLNEWETKIITRFHWTWFNALRDILNTEWFKELNFFTNNLQRQNYTVFPEREFVYRVFNQDLSTIKVVILGQDPYPNSNANGIAFATNKNIKPKSLEFLEKAIKEDMNYPDDWELPNNLNHLTQQGIMLLNSALTVRKGEPNSHADNWKPFIKTVLEILSNQNKPLVFILLGAKAQAFKRCINGISHTILEAEHPARAAYEERTWEYNEIFSKTTDIINITTNHSIKWIT